MLTLALIGLDPGFASLGVARLELRITHADPSGAWDGSEVVDELAVITTAKSDRKREVLATEDNLRRCHELGAALAPWLDSPDVVALCCEAQSWPRNAGAAAKVAMAWGLLAEMARVRGLPVLQASPQQVKVAVAGSKTASKEQVQAALVRRWPGLDERWPRQATLVEHAADALACAVACRQHAVVLGALRAAVVGRRVG